MIATALSRVNRRICVINRPTKVILEAAAVWFPSRVINKCPATMFAIKRTDRVIGRITLLTVSINTMNGINAEGVPEGTRWANICIVLLNHPNIISLIQIGSAKAKVREMWLEAVKIYGKRPKKLFRRINRNNEAKIIVAPLMLFVAKRVLNSKCMVFIIVNRIEFFFVGSFQNIGVTMVRNRVALIQLKGINKEDDGSNLENRFVIIVRGYFLCFYYLFLFYC